MSLKMSATLGKTIYDARKMRRKTLHVLSEEIGVSPGLLSIIEQDKHIPPTELIVRLAGALGGDADQWCSLIGKVTPKAEAAFSKIAKDDPMFFRSMLKKRGGKR